MPDKTKSIRTGHLRSIYLALFAVSGAAGLLYQIVWIRQFTLVLGASAHAVTIVLTVFMAGLGIGAWLLGKIADRLHEKQLAKLYVLLEIGIGLYALALPLFLGWAQQVYVLFYQNCQPPRAIADGARLLVAFLLLIVPTSLMGATLPVMSRYIIRAKSQIPLTVSQLYGLNTLGALLGAIAAGYFLLPNLGILLTSLTAAGINFLVAAVFWGVRQAASSDTFLGSLTESSGSINVGSPTDRGLTRFEKGVVSAFAISGFAAMLYEVAWTRTLTMILGTTTFSFTTMVVTFLFGIAIGSLLFGKIRKLASLPSLFVWVQFLVAFSVILTIPWFERLPFIYLSLQSWAGSTWLSLQFLRFFLAGLVMFLPTFGLGVTFPIVGAILAEHTETLGRRLGKAYGLNTVGAVLGASIGGLFLIPAIGMQKTIILGAVLNLLAGSLVALLWVNRSVVSRVVPALSATMGVCLLLFFLKPWSPWIMSSGVYVYADRYHDVIDRVEAAIEQEAALSAADTWKLWELSMNQYDLLFYDQGPSATVAVMERNDGVRFLTIDGKTDASTGAAHDMKTQIMIAQLPMLFHPNPDKVFVVGFGSGVTVGSVLTHDVRVVDCAELSPTVIEASRFFSQVNHRPLEDERLRIMQRDARNVLLTSTEKYDVVISQPSNPWISGQSSLFSLEWYQLLQDHLEEEGLFVQWLPAYCMSGHDLKVIMHTMRSVFPRTTVWTSGAPGDVILIAKAGEELRIDYRLLQERAMRTPIREDIDRTGCDIELLPFLTFVMNEDELGMFLCSDLTQPLRRNTDDFLITEYSGPKQMASAQIVPRFVDPERMRGKTESVKGILANLEESTVLEMPAN